MQDTFNDVEFAKFGDGIRDLDEDIGQLVYTLFKSKLLETIWSCSGHIGINLMDVGASSRPETHYVYNEGLLFFNVPNSDRSNSFLDIAKTLIKQKLFASYKEPRAGLTNYHSIVLEMKDLSDNVISEEASKRVGLNYCPEKEVKIDLAAKRYSEFVQFWRDLDALAKKRF